MGSRSSRGPGFVVRIGGANLPPEGTRTRCPGRAHDTQHHRWKPSKSSETADGSTESMGLMKDTILQATSQLFRNIPEFSDQNFGSRPFEPPGFVRGDAGQDLSAQGITGGTNVNEGNTWTKSKSLDPMTSCGQPSRH